MKPSAKIQDLDGVSLRTSLLIGFCQSLAMVPGVSRSGATIMGSLLLGLDRKIATEFSFFLAIPTMFAATSFSLYKQRDALMTGDNLALVAIGFVTAFIVALAVVRVAVGFISKHGFRVFAYYRIVLGTLILLTL